MLKKEKEFETSNITEPKKISMSASPETKDEKTVIGEHIFIEGSIRAEEHLFLEGLMKGKVEMGGHNFILGSKGRFEGEILAQNVYISGQMIGSVTAQGKVEIKKEADMSGDIKAKTISVEDGAYFKGSVELEREPNRKPAATGKPIEATALQTDKPAFTPTGDAGKKS